MKPITLTLRPSEYRLRDLAGKGRLVSIKFIILRNMPYYAHPDMEIRTAVYDLETERPVFLKDILPHGNLKNIADWSEKNCD